MNQVIKHTTFLSLAWCAAISTPMYAYAATQAQTATTSASFDKKIQYEEDNLSMLTIKNQINGITRTLRRGSHGDDVKLLQHFLKAYGVYPHAEITGYFGTKTKEAVVALQTEEGLEPVGIVGPKTRATLIQVSKEKLAASSSTPATITAVAITSEINEDGKAPFSLTQFASTTSDIYAVLTLAHAKQDTELGYIRYRDGTYLDSFVSHPNRDQLSQFHFQWSVNPTTPRDTGTYKIRFYVDGKRATEVTFTIQ